MTRPTWTPRTGAERAEDEQAIRKVTRVAYVIPVVLLVVPAAALAVVIWWAVTR